jgi:eukaryotic-like serine/threonine-protein kinase
MNKLGKYQIRRTLGKGAMGIVYEGFDPVIERTVAIKTILPSQLDGAEFVGVMARFKREAQAAGRLNHPGIVAIYDYGEEVPQEVGEEDATMMAPKPQAQSPERVAYIAMEFIKGRELRDFFEKGERFPMPEVVRIMSEMLDALDHAHSHGVVHRDMKPANLILLDNGRVKVADFGIARVEASELTQTGTVLGTPTYMSPEQFMGHPVDGRSDLFSCGVILYQLLTGEKPFTGESTTTIMYKVLREEPVPPSQLNLSLAPALDAVMKKALAKNPAERFQSGHEFAQALQAAVAAPNSAPAPAHAPAPAIPVISMGPLQDPPAAAAAKPAAAAAMAPSATRGRQIPAGVWAVAGAAFVAVAAGAYVVLAPGRGNAPSAAVAQAPAAVASAPAALPAAAPAVAAANTPAPAAGTLVISALGVVDPQDARFHGDMAAAQVEARNDAKRQLVEKALALYVDKASLASNHALIETRLLANSGEFIRSVLQEDPAGAAKGGTVEMQTRAVVSMRDVQRSLNQLSREERVEFIRNKGDPRISIRIDIGNAEGAALAPGRSQLAENVVKDRIKSFGFRVWAPEGDSSANAQAADFAIKGEVKVKQLSMKLPASGLTITKTALTSWTLKAIETATGEEVYLSTKLPTGQSWASEDQALAEIGKLVGDEFSRNFFLQHFEFRTQKTNLLFTGLPEGGSALLLRELRGMRAVLDAQAASDGGRFQVQLAEGSAPDLVQDAIVRPLNAKLGLDCFALARTAGSDVTIAYSASCATPQMRTKLESGPPAGWLRGPQPASPAPAKAVTPSAKAT